MGWGYGGRRYETRNEESLVTLSCAGGACGRCACCGNDGLPTLTTEEHAMNNELRKRFPSHAGLNADWSVCAWHLGTTADVELWLLEDEESYDDSFEICSRVWDDAEGCGTVELLRSGVSVEEAAKLLGVNA